jgi:hypothetical protein
MMENRRGFFRGLPLALAGLFAAGTAKAATRVHVEQLRGAPGTLAGFNALGNGQPVNIGAGLAYSSGVLTAAGSTNVPVSTRNVLLVRDAGGMYPLPANVQKNTAIHRNGIRQQPGGDYNITSGTVVPTPAVWLADDIVLADGDA